MNLSLPKVLFTVERQAPKEQKLIGVSQIVEQMIALMLVVLLVLGSALAVIYTAYDYRRLFHQHQTLVRESDLYRVEWAQLLLEQSTWGANNRVEKLADDRLGMHTPDPKEIRLIRHE